MNKSLLTLLVLALVSSCGSSSVHGTGSGHGDDAGVDAGPPPPMPGGPNDDTDHDGYTPNTGDCNDSSPLVNPAAVEMPGNGVDDDCNGQVDEPQPTCDSANTGKNDPTSLVQAFEQCDKRFFIGATLNGPSVAGARNVVDSFGVVMPMGGRNMAMLSTGKATTSASYEPQDGTNFGVGTFPNPAPDIDTSSACTTKQDPQPDVYDYTELVVKLKAPSNATSFSFKFHFFSTEYPEFVCKGFNDQFLVLMESQSEFQKATNIAFDMNKNPITVNSGFFTVCDSKFQPTGTAQGQHCTTPLSSISGTGYDRVPKWSPVNMPADAEAGGSTGWLTTTGPVTPNEELTLHFVIFDEGDGILDSAVLIDNFVWGAQAIDSPTTIQ